MNNASIILDDPTWVIVAKGVLVFALCVVLTLLSVWGERRIVARMQMRMGPNRVGPFGLVQALADGVKLALKEDIIPAAADRAVFVIAPIISVTTCFMAFAVIPLTGEVNFFGEQTIMQLTDLPVGVLYVLATASIGVYGIVLAGWSSGSTYPLLGGLRSSAQVISSNCYGTFICWCIYLCRIHVNWRHNCCAINLVECCCSFPFICNLCHFYGG